MSERTEGKWPERSQNQEARHTPNVKPKPRPGESGSQEDHEKKESPAHARRSRSSDAECCDEKRPQGRSEETERPGGEEPETNLEKIQPDLLDQEDAACAICLCAYDNAFKTPKLLSCRHTFCLECLARINVTSPKLEVLSCPVCRKPTPLPRSQDLPGLQDNQDVLRQLPPDRQRALSVRFKRRKGRLLLKCPPPAAAARSYLMAPATKDERGHVTDVEQGAVHTTVAVDVGKPPNRVTGALLRFYWGLFFTSMHAMALVLLAVFAVMLLVCSGRLLPFDWCYYCELIFIVTFATTGGFAVATSRLPSLVIAFFQCDGNMPV